MLTVESDQKIRLPAAFNRLLVAWFSSLMADGMRFAAVPLLALTTDPTPAAVSAVAAAMALPWLLVALPAGALVDRLDPARVIAGANVVRAITAALLVAAVMAGGVDIPLLCVVGFALTAAETFADSAAQSLLVRIVPSGQLELANARFVSSENIGLDMIGPVLSGALFAVATWLPFAVSGVIFVASALFTLTLTGYPPDVGDRPGAGYPPEVGHPEVGHPGVGRPGVGHSPAVGHRTEIGHSPASHSPAGCPPEVGRPPEVGYPPGAGPIGEGAVSGRRPAMGSNSAVPRPTVREGFRTVFSDSGLRTLVITVAVMACAIAATEGVLVVYSTSSLHLPKALYPTLLASYSVGLLVSAALVGRLGRTIRPGSLMLGSIAVIGVTLAVLGSFPHPVVAWCCFALMGGAAGTWNILSATRRQRRTPPDMLARVSSTFRAIAWGALPLGTALGGFGGQRWGVPAVFLVAGVLVLVLGCVVSPFFLRTDTPDPG